MTSGRASTIASPSGTGLRPVGSPGIDWHVLDLYARGGAEVAITEGDGGPVLDSKARDAYRRRYRELAAELAVAEDFADLGRADHIGSEMEALEAQMLEAFGLAGRSRNLRDPAERARVNVRRSIMRAIAAVEDVAPVVGDHLRFRVKTGRLCRYQPELTSAVAWHLG